MRLECRYVSWRGMSGASRARVSFWTAWHSLLWRTGHRIGWFR